MSWGQKVQDLSAFTKKVLFKQDRFQYEVDLTFVLNEDGPIEQGQDLHHLKKGPI